MIIDAHAHLGNFNGKRITPKKLLSDMDEAGIQYALIISSRLSNVGDKSGITMDEAVTIGKRYKRLKAIGNVEFATFGEGQIKVLKKYILEKKIYGIKLYPGYENYFPFDERLFPLYDFCQKKHVPVIYHTGLLEINFPGLLAQSHPLNIDAVANRFPKLPIIMAHVGNPWILDAGAVMMKNTNVYADFSGYFTEYKAIAEHQIQDFIYQMQRLEAFLDTFERFLFGTDYPLYSLKEYREAVERLPLRSHERDLVFWKNAKKLFHLEI